MEGSDSACRRTRRRTKRRGIQKLQMPELPTTASIPDAVVDDPEFDAIISRFNPAAEPEEDPDTPGSDESWDSEAVEISRQKVRKYGRPSVAALKAVSRRPELIEPHDTDAPDPYTLAELKNARNVVPVPAHWSQKRKYLNYKKGSEVSRYRLPNYLEKTGIGKMRQAVRESDERKSLQQRQRDRAKPKMGMIDVPPALLHDAFFRQQERPTLSRFGDMYFENKESTPSARNIRPGRISEKLREALGMVDNAPPPWLRRMQKLGPPPSYPNVRIPGLNAPLPPRCEWGNHHGGWGQVPLAENGTPVWGGNPFAMVDQDAENECQLWGVMERGSGVCEGVNI